MRRSPDCCDGEHGPPPRPIQMFREDLGINRIVISIRLVEGGTAQNNSIYRARLEPTPPHRGHKGTAKLETDKEWLFAEEQSLLIVVQETA